ncbi:MAG TPA: iron-containing alcohol dehydrogenase [Tepidisphaeraceae bacterium]|nr:iron-containing alcohol dehydrogenase [Tepidisphaeraceae bacterium]
MDTRPSDPACEGRVPEGRTPESRVPESRTPESRIIVLRNPHTLAFGAGCAARCGQDLVARSCKRVLVVTGRFTRSLANPLCDQLRAAGVTVTIHDRIGREPTIDMVRTTLSAARDAHADAVVGFGGGSPMDVAKLVAALLDSKQDLCETFGIGKVTRRSTCLACVPTTAGTGSEVSPNAVILDENESLKKAVISPHLVPDAAYVDPLLTLSVPPDVTAATGMDALTHCIEAYANRFAHPLVDTLALEGVRLIAGNLAQAVEHGHDLASRSAVAMGSLYGGMCLGPVNTAAVHALAYPLASAFHVPHGLSNAVLLPHVLAFNLPAAPDRYASIARAMDAEPAADDLQGARNGLQQIREVSRRCGIPSRMSELGVPTDAIERMARSAMTVTRLLERNVREVTFEDAIDIYRRAM